MRPLRSDAFLFVFFCSALLYCRYCRYCRYCFSGELRSLLGVALHRDGHSHRADLALRRAVELQPWRRMHYGNLAESAWGEPHAYSY